jgi:hypothetical protein
VPGVCDEGNAHRDLLAAVNAILKGELFLSREFAFRRKSMYPSSHPAIVELAPE